jgi:ribosomal protein S18 acetylase RimI-like enzyme
MSTVLASGQLDAVVGIDAALIGRSRRAYFERRLAAAQRDPERHLQVAVGADGVIAGFMLGRVLEGEFGRSEPQVRLEAFGVRPAAQHRGLGHELSAAFEAQATKRGIAEIRTTALWRHHELLRFLDRAGYRLAENAIVDCAVAAQRDDFERPARDAFAVGTLAEADLEEIVRIDRRNTGRDRHAYLCRSVRDALADSALRISLAARADGAVAGFLMASLDYGDFGRVEPVAVIDTIGVDPLRARQGVGRALLSQLFVNLAALRVERVETALAPGEQDLADFFHAAGFRLAERLAFAKRL